MKTTTFHGRFNRTNFLLGLLLLFLGMGSCGLILGLSVYEPETVTAVILGVPVGLLLIFDAARHRHLQVTIGPEGITADEQEMRWQEVAGAEEEIVTRYLKLFRRRWRLRRVRRVTLWGIDRAPLVIKDEWLHPADYDQLLAKMRQIISIPQETIVEEG